MFGKFHLEINPLGRFMHWFYISSQLDECKCTWLPLILADMDRVGGVSNYVILVGHGVYKDDWTCNSQDYLMKMLIICYNKNIFEILFI
jgi:hypothetical protein